MDVKFEDTAFYDWLKTNRWWLIAAVAFVCAVQGYSYFAPRWKQSSLQESWQLYDSVMAELDLERIESALDRARQDDRVYPWVVMQATRTAMSMDHEEALEVLVPALQTLTDRDRADLYRVPVEGETVTIPAYLARHAQAQAAADEEPVENPTPTGEDVEISVTLSTGDSYTVSVGLYPEAAPETCAAFAAAVAAGRFDGTEGRMIGPRAAQWDGMAPEDVEGGAFLPLEREFGYFHMAGSLSTVSLTGGRAGEQDPDKVQLLLQSNLQLDGRTNVFGQVTSGLDELRAALEAVDPGAGFTISSIRMAGDPAPGDGEGTESGGEGDSAEDEG